MSKVTTPRKARSLDEMVAALARQVRLLDVYIEKGFTDSDYLSEVAGKLRLLIVEIPRNSRHKPLLLAVAKECSITLSLTPPGDGPVKAVTWQEYLDQPFMTRPDRPDQTATTLNDFIRGWAEQLGGPHEDWEVDQWVVEVIQFGARVVGTGLPLSQHNLLTIAQAVSASAKAVLREAKKSPRLKAGGTRDV